jgi:hypothetical protein
MTAVARRVLSAVSGLALLAAVGCADPKLRFRAEGQAEAERDLAAGRLCQKTYGLPAPWCRGYEALAGQKLGVEFRAVAGCVVDEELIERVAGYNELMRRAIEGRFGKRALDDFAEAARVQYQQAQDARRGIKP